MHLELLKVKIEEGGSIEFWSFLGPNDSSGWYNRGGLFTQVEMDTVDHLGLYNLAATGLRYCRQVLLY